LLATSYAKSRAAAVVLAQRLLDAQRIRNVVDDAEFEDSNSVLYTLSMRESLLSCPSASKLLHEDPEGVHSGFLFARGFRYNRFFVVLSRLRRMLYFFRNSKSRTPYLEVRLKNASYRLYFVNTRGQPTSGSGAVGISSPKNAKTIAAAAAFAVENVVPRATRATSMFMFPSKRESVIKSSTCYLELYVATRAFVFRLDDIKRCGLPTL